MPNSQAQDIKQLQEDLQRLKEDVENKAKKQDTNKQRWQELLVFALIPCMLIVALSLSISNMMRLNEYDKNFKALDKLKKHTEELNEIKRDVPLLKKSLTNEEKRIRKIKNLMTSAKQDIKYLQKELENMNSTDKKVKAIESSVSSIKNDYSKLIKLSDNQREQWEELNTSIETTKSKIVSLMQNADDANSTVAPIIQKQTELFKNITDSNRGMLEINDTVNNMTLRLLEVTRNVTDLQPQLEIIGKVAAQMNETQEGVDQLETEMRNVNSTMSKLNSETKETESIVSKMSTKVDELSSGVSGYEKELKTLQNLQSEVNTKIEKSHESTKQLENDVSDAKVRVDILLTEVTESGHNVEDIKSDIAEAASKIQKEMWFCNDSIDSLNNTMANLSKEISSNATYIENTVPSLVSSVKTLRTSAAFPWMSVVSVFDVLVILVVIVVLLINPHLYNGHAQNQMPQNPNSYGHDRRQELVRPQSILDNIHTVPILQNKVCVLSFYSETMNLHRKLVDSALATSRKGNSMEVMQYLVRKHEDILGIPSARYIFVFVDFNERNVILENPGQDLGDKKLVTVQAAQKIGADVFVTYVRDKGSNQLFPGNLFNQELSAFTSHHVLKRLENKQRCFSVYETFNNTQKESIVHSVL